MELGRKISLFHLSIIQDELYYCLIEGGTQRIANRKELQNQGSYAKI